MTFDELDLIPRLLANVKASGYETPTPIQQNTIPLVLRGSDVLGCAQTGTGKTAAFALPILQNLTNNPRKPGDPTVIRCLILTPTRELAMQIYENFVQYGKQLPVTSAVIFGGVDQKPQVAALHRGADVVVACPGRLWDLMNQGYVRLDWVETFVLDEADRMLDMGFIHDVRRIAGKLPDKHQTLLFSATMPTEVEKLAMDLLHHPESVKVDPVSSTVDAIEQHMYFIDKVNKRHLLAQMLKDPSVENALVFSRTRHGADRIVRDLKRDGISADAIHGDKTQGARQAALNRFKTGESKVLVATDIAARGIDIAGLSHVFNYDMPMEPEAYVHRIGRTGRAGRTGIAISFCCIDEMKQLGQVEKLIGKRFKPEESDWPMQVFTPSEPKQRPPRPETVKKLNSRGEAVVTRHSKAPAAEKTLPKAVRPAPRTNASAAVKDDKPKHREAPVSPSGVRLVIPSMPPKKSVQTITIGKNGRMKSAGAEQKPHQEKPRTPERREQRGTGKPVQRINRHKKG